jgi:hypothetical protein
METSMWAPESSSYCLSGVVAYVPHVGRHDVQTEVLDEPVELGDASLVGRQLRSQVRDVVLRASGRELSSGEDLEHRCLAHPPPTGEQHVVDEDPFLLDPAAERWHGSRRRASDVGVVTA